MEVLDPRLRLRFNPFDPAASGPPVSGPVVPPGPVEQVLRERLTHQSVTAGTHLTVIVGEYGAGKTCCLRWLEQSLLPELRVQPYYFQDPGVQFYDLADSWLRMIGRKNLAKTIWELVHTRVRDYQPGLFGESYLDYAGKVRTTRDAQRLTGRVQDALRECDITRDEEIAKCLAQIVTETPIKPYFEYRDFIASNRKGVVAERQEPEYFKALLRALSHATKAHAFAFLLDEFEEIGLQDKTRRRTAAHYLTTLKRLVDLAQPDDTQLRVVLTMTPEAYRQTKTLAPALADRLGGERPHVHLAGQTNDQAHSLVSARLEAAQSSPDGSLFPFGDIADFSPSVLSSPRRLVQTCSVAISRVTSATEIPFTSSYLHEVETQLYGTDEPEVESPP